MIISSSYINPPFESSDTESYYDSLNNRLTSYINYLRNSNFKKYLDIEDFVKFEVIKNNIKQVLCIVWEL